LAEYIWYSDPDDALGMVLLVLQRPFAVAKHADRAQAIFKEQRAVLCHGHRAGATVEKLNTE
jgi:cytochrome c551/c552